MILSESYLSSIGLRNSRHGNGTVDIYLLKKVKFRYTNQYSAEVYTDVSVSGGTGSLNGAYNIAVSADGYVTQIITAHAGDTDNIILVPETTFTDIMDLIRAGMDVKRIRPHPA